MGVLPCPLEVLQAAGEQIVDADNLVVALEEQIAEMGPKEPSAAGDEDPLDCYLPTPW